MTTAHDLMSKEFFTADIRAPVSVVVRLISENDTPCVIITDKKNNCSLEGVITERDLIRKLLYRKNGRKKARKSGNRMLSTSDIMTHKVVTVSPSDDMLSVQELLAKNRIKQVPVVENGAVIGLLRQESVAGEVHAVEQKNRTFTIYQNAQTMILTVFLLFLIIYFLMKLVR